MYLDSYQVSDSGFCILSIASSKTNFISNHVKDAGASVGSRGVKFVDITDLSGIYYILLRNGSQNSSGVGKAYKIWLE